MLIGIPKEIKIGETRVSMTPSLCRRCVKLGAKVLVEKSAGASAGFTDAEYRAAGATIAGSADKVWASADLILKVIIGAVIGLIIRFVIYKFGEPALPFKLDSLFIATTWALYVLFLKPRLIAVGN